MLFIMDIDAYGYCLGVNVVYSMNDIFGWKYFAKKN